MRWIANIEWDDGEVCEGYIFSDEDVADDDDNIFFYVDGEYDMRDMLTSNSNDFTILNYEELYNV